MLPEVTVSVLLSGSNFTVLFENPDKVLTAYAKFLGNDVNSILSFSFYIYEEIKKRNVVILFYTPNKSSNRSSNFWGGRSKLIDVLRELFCLGIRLRVL
jgi:hypothetical protein